MGNGFVNFQFFEQAECVAIMRNILILATLMITACGGVQRVTLEDMEKLKRAHEEAVKTLKTVEKQVKAFEAFSYRHGIEGP